jgi:hypothetical protein
MKTREGRKEANAGSDPRLARPFISSIPSNFNYGLSHGERPVAPNATTNDRHHPHRRTILPEKRVFFFLKKKFHLVFLTNLYFLWVVEGSFIVISDWIVEVSDYRIFFVDCTCWVSWFG